MSSASTRNSKTFLSTLFSIRWTRPPEQPEKLVRIMAGTVTLTGLGLGFFVSPWGYLLTVFAGLNVLQSAFTGFCPPEITYRWLEQTSKASAPPAQESRAESPTR
jgi:hypothetical protein